jgi:hypothetical protein
MLLKYGLKSSAQVVALAEALAKLRGEIGPDVSVNNVNVEAGGQAIVGKVAVDRRAESPEEVPVTPQRKRTG